MNDIEAQSIKSDGPEFRIVGTASDEDKQTVAQKARDRFSSHLISLPPEDQKIIRKYEKRKTPEHALLIKAVNKITSDSMVECGLKPYDIPQDNYHFLPMKPYKRLSLDIRSPAVMSYKQQTMAFAKDYPPFNNSIILTEALLHETYHLKGYYAIQVDETEGKKEEASYREGTTVYGRQELSDERKWHQHFIGLHEAIVTNAVKKSFGKLMELKTFREERRWLQSQEARNLIGKESKEQTIPAEDFYWVGKRRSMLGKEKTDASYFGYYQQRCVLDLLCQEIQTEFPEQYKSSDKVFKEFLKAHFTGQILTIARLVEKTFGKGSFRVLGNMTPDVDSGVLHLEYFEKARAKTKPIKTGEMIIE